MQNFFRFLRNFKQRPQLVQNDLTQPITIFPYMPYQKWVKRAQQRRIGPQNKRGRKRKYPLPEDKECSSLYASAASTSSCSTQLESPPSFNEKKPESLLFNETTPTTIKRVKVLAPTLASRQSSRVSKPTTRMAEFRNLGLETTNDDSSFPKEEKPTSLLHDVQPSEHSSSSATPRFFASGQVVRAGPATPRVGIPVARQVGRSGRFLTSGLPMSLRQAPVVARVSGTGARAGITTSLKPMSIRFQTLGLNTRLIKVRRPDQVPVSLRTLGTTAQPTKTIRYMISNKGPASTAELSTSTESRDSTLPDKEVKKEYSTASIPCEEKPELLDDTLPGQLETAGASGPNAAQFSVSTMESTPPKRQTVPYLSNESILRDLGPSAAPLIDSVLRQRTELRREREQQKKAADFPLSGSTEIPTTACAQIKHDNPNSSPQNLQQKKKQGGTFWH
uniref:Uncharacterized protein n=1 Tax=Caenorhabditis japonica TaxID=281687 RepID=A0A8R1IKY8_CAEJA